MELEKTENVENEVLCKELVKIAKKSRFKKKTIATSIVAVLFLLTALFAWIYGRNQVKESSAAEMQKLMEQLAQKDEEIQELIENPIVVNPVAPEINLGIIYSEISDIGELATVEYLFTDAAKYSDSKQIKNWNIPFTEKSFTLKWDGVIKAGVVLDSVVISVNEEEKLIEVSIPSAQILSYEIDQDSIEIIDEKDNILNNISVEDKIKFDSSTEDAMKNRAIENGILDKAQKNAEDILKRLLTANTAITDEYTITFVVQN